MHHKSIKAPEAANAIQSADRTGESMRILILPAYYGVGRDGAPDSGHGIFFREQALALANQGHDVTVLHAHFDTQGPAYVKTRVEPNGMREIIVHVPASRLPINIARRAWLLVRAYRASFADDPPEVIHAHSYPAALSAIPISAFTGIPYVITEHSSNLLTGLTNNWRRFARVAYSRASKVLAVSSGLATAMSRVTPRPITVVPNLVTAQFLSSPGLEPTATAEFGFVSIGYCHPNKGWDILIQAFALLLKSRAQATLTLCGGQDDCHELFDEVHRLGIADNVRFTGRISRREVKAHLDAANCHVMPSRFETFGIATIEALACGKPVIMTATAAAAEIVNPSNGLTTPIGDSAALASAMEWMVNNAASYNQHEIRDACRAKYSETAVCAQLARIYEQVAK